MTTHQELFEAWIHAELNLVGHVSGNFDQDAREILGRAQRYQAHYMHLRIPMQEFEGYLREDDE